MGPRHLPPCENRKQGLVSSVGNATGLSAAIALSKRVLDGGKAELDAYMGFLKVGCSKDPLDLLKGAGVDMTRQNRWKPHLSSLANW